MRGQHPPFLSLVAMSEYEKRKKAGIRTERTMIAVRAWRLQEAVREWFHGKQEEARDEEELAKLTEERERRWRAGLRRELVSELTAYAAVVGWQLGNYSRAWSRAWDGWHGTVRHFKTATCQRCCACSKRRPGLDIG